MAVPRSQAMPTQGSSRVPRGTYDPNQDLEEKRAIRAGYRDLLEQAEQSRSEAHSSDFGELSNLLTKSNDLYLRVKAPSEGVLDSRVLVSVAQTGRVLADSLKRQSVGFDMDSFMEKAIRFIGGNGAAARAAIAGSENDDGHATNAEWDWNKLGRTAMKYSRRVPATDALLGPLKVEHKKRQTTHRRRNIDRAQQAEKPAELGSNDIQKDSNNTTDRVIQIKEMLDNYSEEGVSIFQFAFDPKSFGNTVENLFYISFLVRDGHCAIIMPGEDDNDSDQPKLMGCSPATEEDYQQGLARQQVILELDPPTWRAIIDRFNITSCVIPTREIQRPVLQQGKWYA